MIEFIIYSISVVIIGYFLKILTNYLLKIKNNSDILNKRISVYTEILNEISNFAVDESWHNSANYVDGKSRYEYIENIKQKEKNLKYTINKLLLYGSDNVINSYNQWIKNSTNDEQTEDNINDFKKFILEMRKEILEKTNLSTDDIKSINIFTYNLPSIFKYKPSDNEDHIFLNILKNMFGDKK